MPVLEAALLRRVAVAADVDPRTIIRVLTGRPVRGIQRERIRRALREAVLAAP